MNMMSIIATMNNIQKIAETRIRISHNINESANKSKAENSRMQNFVLIHFCFNEQKATKKPLHYGINLNGDIKQHFMDKLVVVKNASS